MECLFHVCEMDVPSDFGTEFTNDSINDVLKEIGLNINYLMNYYSPPVHDGNKRFEFSDIVTDEGLCFAFNALNSNEMYTDAYGIFFNAYKFYVLQNFLQLNMLCVAFCSLSSN